VNRHLNLLRNRVLVIPAALALVAAGFLLPGSPAPAAPVAVAPASGKLLVSPDSLIESVKWLADDAREGRMTGSPGCEASAKYIAEHFAADGLEPAGDDGTWLQNYEATIGVQLGDGNALRVDGVEGLEDLEIHEDFIPFGFSESGTVDVPVVFAGYGITDDEANYDDYTGVDVKGKAVLVLRHEPQQDDSTSVFNGRSFTQHALFRSKAINAREHGAVAMLVFTGPLSQAYEKDKLTRLDGAEGIGGGNLLAVHVKKYVGEAMLKAAGTDVREWMEEVDKDLKPRSFAFDPSIRVHLMVSVAKDRRPTANVVGILPGTDPDAGAVILGAHYDHLGRGNSSSLAPDQIGEIHNGADDNASGTAALMELARVFGATGPARRTLVFAAFSGEELGLLGSSYMASHPPVPLETVQAMVNMDMVGRPRDGKITVGGIATSPEFKDLIARASEGSPLTVGTSKSGYGASDHTSFYVKNVPVLFFFSGLHSDYHKPSDDWWKIDKEGLAEVTKVVYATVTDLANRDDRIEFAKAAEDSAGPHGRGGGGGYGPYLGTIPDFGDYEGGVKLAGIKTGSPAEKAGMKAGDMVIRFAGKKIGDLYAYTYALRDQKPGDTVEIVVLRDGKEVTVHATLESRD
jgi:aminopeptidase YwaD